MPLIRKSDYARHRGVSPAAVTTAIKTGRIRAAVVTRNGKELLDRDKADELWGKNTLQQSPGSGGARLAPVSTPTDEQLRSLIEGLPEDQIPDLNDSRARREHYLAEKARLEALRGREELVPAADVKAEAFALARSVRDGMMRLPDRLAPLLAATLDAREVHRMLTEEIRIALRGLADG